LNILHPELAKIRLKLPTNDLCQTFLEARYFLERIPAMVLVNDVPGEVAIFTHTDGFRLTRFARRLGLWSFIDIEHNVNCI